MRLLNQLCTLSCVLQALEAIFLFCVVWSCGAAIVQRPGAEDRDRFDRLLKSLAGLGTADGDTLSAAQLPARPLYDYFFDGAAACWKSWGTAVGAYAPPASGRFSDVVVPTADLVRSTWLLRTVLSVGAPCLFVGESGTAKTVTVQKYLHALDPAASVLLGLNFSSRTTSADVQRSIEDATEKRAKDTYGPPVGKRLFVFLDDLNMPRVDRYGTQQPLALLKLLIEREGFYDRGKELNWMRLKDLHYAAAMGPPGGARNAVDPRLLSLFNVFEIQFPAPDNLRTIFQSILAGHLVPFKSDVAAVCAELTDVTLAIYAAVVEKLPPTPLRFHYIFNLRDLSRVFEGLLRATPDKAATPAQFVRLWRNEVLRIFHDRLINEHDKALVVGCVRDAVRARFPAVAEPVLAEPIVYGEFKHAARLIEDPDADAVRPFLCPGCDQGVAECGMQPSRACRSACTRTWAGTTTSRPSWRNCWSSTTGRTSRCSSCSSRTRSSTLRASCAPSRCRRATASSWAWAARASAASPSSPRTRRRPRCLRSRSAAATTRHPSATTSRCALPAPRSHRSCGAVPGALNRQCLQTLYDKLGRENKRVVFLFTDAHVADEGFLEAINNMLTTGMVAALYDDGEKDACISAVRDEAAALGLPGSKESCWAYFVSKCRDNLHVVLAMSPVGDALRTRCRNFPGMVNNTVIDWFDPWPQQALSAVATVFLAAEDLPPPAKAAVVEHMMLVHRSVREHSARFLDEMRRHNYVTPKNYLNFISTYRASLADNRQAIADTAARLDGGLKKLVQAATEVEDMKAELSAAKVVVEAATTECDALIEHITASRVEVEAKGAAAAQKEEQLKVDSADIAVEKEEAEAALAEAIPALEEAAAALQDLKKDDITEIRSFAKPNAYVQKVCECVVHLKGGKDTSWGGAKVMMSDGGFLRSLVEFDKDALSDKQVRGGAFRGAVWRGGCA